MILCWCTQIWTLLMLTTLYFWNKMPEQPSSCCWISFLKSRKGECTRAFAFSPHLFNYKQVITNKKSQTSEREKAIIYSRKAREVVSFLKNCIKQAMRDLTIPLLLPRYNTAYCVLDSTVKLNLKNRFNWTEDPRLSLRSFLQSTRWTLILKTHNI